MNVAVAVGVGVDVAVAVGVGVELAVAVAVGVGLAVGVGVGVPPPAGAWIATIIGEPVLKKPTVALAFAAVDRRQTGNYTVYPNESHWRSDFARTFRCSK